MESHLGRDGVIELSDFLAGCAGCQPLVLDHRTAHDVTRSQQVEVLIRNIHSDGDTVLVLFDAASQCLDGKPYRNTYAWFMQMKDGRAVNVTAFFDTKLFDEMWMRVAPKF